jgi:predicted outer membrane repeat protein
MFTKNQNRYLRRGNAKPNLYKILSGIFVFICIFSLVLPGAVYAIPVPQSGKELTLTATGELKRGYNPETGKVSFIGAENPVKVQGVGSVKDVMPQQRAMNVASIYGREFGLKNPSQELKLLKSQKDKSGNDVVHYQQEHKGIPVIAGELIVNMNTDGELLSMSGEVSSELTLDTNPSIQAQAAKATAMDAVTTWHGVDAKELTATTPELWIFDESLLTASTRPIELVWRMEVTPKDSTQPIREMVLVNAQTGEVSFHVNEVDTAWHSHSAEIPTELSVSQNMPSNSSSSIQYADLVVDEVRGVLYGVDTAGNKIDIISMNDLSITGSYWLGYGTLPSGIDLSLDGSELAVAQSGSSQLSFINLADGTISNLSSVLSGSSTKATDVLYGRPGILYALSNRGIHVINTSVMPHAEDTTQYLSVDGSSNGTKFGELSSDQKTLYYVTGIPWSASNILGKVDVSEGLTKPTILKKASMYQTSMVTNLRLSLIDDGTVLISTGSVYNTADLIPKARNGQTLLPVTAIPNHDFYVTAYDDATGIDSLYFFDNDSSYKVSMLETVIGVLGAMAVTGDGNRLFISSTGGMTAIDLGATPPGIPVPLPDSLKQYRDFAFDMPHNRVYGTDASNRVDVIDQDSGNVLTSYLLPNGANPIGIDLSPDGDELAIALNGLEKILFINPENGAKIAEVTPKAVASSYYANLPYDVIYGRSGRLYAAGHPSSYGSDYLHVIDAVSHTWLARSTVYLDISNELAITSDKRFVYANDFSSSYNLHVFDVQTDTMIEVSKDAISANKFAVTPDGSKTFTSAGSVWGTNTKESLGTLEGAPGNLIEYIPGQNTVTLAAQDGNNSVLKFISDANYRLLTTYNPEYSGTILEMELAPDGSRLVASFSDGNLLLLDISTILPVYPSPPSLVTTKYSDLIIDESRGKLYGADQVGHKIDVINMSDMQVSQSYFLVYGSSPTGLDLSPDGNTLAVAQSNLQRLAFIDLTDGTIFELPTLLSGSGTKGMDVLYGRPGVLYTLSSTGLHVIDTNVFPPAEITTQYISLSSSDWRFGALSSDKNTLYYVAAANSSQDVNLVKFNVLAELPKPVKLIETYLNKADGLKNIRLSLVDDNTLLTSFGTIYQTYNLQPKAKNGQILSPVTTLPGRNFYVTVNDDPSDVDVLNFFDLQSSYRVSTLSTGVNGTPGAIAVTSNGNVLFVSSTGGMTKFQISSIPPGTPVDVPQSLRQYRDFVFDLPRGIIYGTDVSGRIDVMEQSTGNLLDSYVLVNGSDPMGIDLSPDGSELAVALNGLEAILFLNSSTGVEIARVTPKMLGVNYSNQPYDVIYGRAGRLYSDGNSSSADFIHAIDTTTHTWLARSASSTNTGAELSLTADKKYLYFNSTLYPNNIYGFDVQTDVLTSIYRTPHGPALADKITITPDGSRIFTSNGQVWSRDLQDQIGVLEGVPGELIKYIPNKNVVALTDANNIKFIDAINYQLISTYMLDDPGELLEMEISPDGIWMILNFSTGSVKILEIASILPENPSAPLPSSIKYEELLVDQTRNKLYGADKIGNKVDVIDMSTLSVVNSFSLAYGALPTGIDLSPDGNTLAVAQSGFNRVMFIQVYDGTQVESPALQNSPYATTKVYDVLYGRSNLLYALTTSGLHVLDISLNPPAEDGTQFVVFDEDSAKFGAITSDKNTLFVGENNGNTGHEFVHQFSISAGLDKPVEVAYTSFYNPYMTQLRITDDNVLVTSWGSTYDTSMLMLKAKNGQSPVNVMTIPGRSFYAVAYNNSDPSLDGLYFFDNQSSHKLSSLSTGRLGSPGAMAVTNDGDTLFVSSSGGMTKYEIGATPPGTQISLPQRVGEYRDFAFDIPRGIIYGTDASGRVDVLNQNSGEVIKSYLLPNGANPKGIDLSQNGNELAVALGGLEAILFMNPETGAEIARVTPKLAFTTYYFNWPYDVIYGRDGRLYSDGNTVDRGTNDYIHVYDTTTHTWLGTGNKLVRYASELALTADKKYLYVADTNSSTNNFHVFDVQTDTPTRLYVATAGSQKFTISPDGGKLFYSSGQVWSGDLQTQLGTLPGGASNLIKFIPGKDALALSVGNAIRFVSASDYRILFTYPVSYAGDAIEMEVSPDGNRIIANYANGGIFILDLSTFPPSAPTSTPTLTPGPGPSKTPGPTLTPGPSPTPVPKSATGNRRTYTVSGGYALPGTFLCDQNQPNCTNGTNPDADAAHQYTADTFIFYNTHHGRNSFDNSGATIVSSVHYGVGYQNAFWDGYQMVYGDSMVADDVVGHELTHAVTQYSSDLIYSYQSGAINESFSDVWGEFIDQTNGSGNDSSSVKWAIGEDSALGIIRSMSNPPSYGDPDKMSSPYYYNGSGDSGGVHTNSGVNNKAAYLMVEGGTFNGRTILGIGLNKTAAIYYEAQINLLTAGSNYNDLYYALNQACQNLLGGVDGITQIDCDQVKTAAEAVEMLPMPAPITYTISGNVGTSGVMLSYIENDVTKVAISNSIGDYSIQVPEHWSGTVIPSKTEYVFAPVSRDYSDVKENYISQNYVATQTIITISGNVRYEGVVLSYYEDGTLKTTTSNSAGNYSFKVKAGWSGTVTPSKAAIIFGPASRSYENVQNDQTAQNYKASTLVITISDSGPGSLRQVIADADYGDIITFSPDLAGQTIVLETTLSIDKGLIIAGAGLNPRIEISGNGAVQIFSVGPEFDDNGLPPNVKFQSLVLKNGTRAMRIGAGNIFIEDVSFVGNTAQDGGAIYSCCYNTTITISDSDFTSNSAQRYGGAIHTQFGSLTLQANTFTNNSSGSVGGAISIEREGPYTFEENTFSNNSALSGGAIRFESVDDAVILRGNLFSGNSASLNGGAIFEMLAYSSASFTIENNTFYGNNANDNGGGILISDTATIINNTFSNNEAMQNGGNLYLGHAYLYNNILANNTGGGDCYVNSYGWVIGGNNLIEDGSQNCAATITGDPMLGLLSNNGGSTMTMVLLPDSLAIDAGDDTNCPETDQRGVTRPQRSQCDMGAYEYEPVATVELTVTADDQTITYGDGDPTFTFTYSGFQGGDDETDIETPPTCSVSGVYNDAGIYTISCTGAVDSHGVYVFNYVDGDLTINQATPILSVTNSPVPYTGSAQTADVSSGSVAGTVDNIQYDGSTTVPVNAGTYAVTADFTPDDTTNYNSLTNASAGDFVINKATPTLSVTNSPVPYTGSAQTADVSSGSVAGTVGNVQYDGSTTAPVNAGTYAITADFTPDDTTNYISLTNASAGDFVIESGLTITLQSVGAQDGWILESSETSNKGGKLNKTATTLRLGDDAANRQYRSILSFDTSALPEGTQITSVTLKFKYAGKSGTDPFTKYGNLLVDICKGAFKGNSALQLGDFKPTPACGKNQALIYTNTKVDNWYSQSLNPLDFGFINLDGGVTQFRLRFSKDDNNDFGADFLKLYSGNATTEADRPQLIIEYYVQ